MAEQSVVIRISAKNLTAAEFKKARQQVLGLGDETKKTTRKVSGLEGAFKSIARSVPGALKIVAGAAAVTAGAIAALGVAVVKLGQRGTELVGIKESFQRLTAAAGESGETMIAVTKTATKGLITDLEIMQQANKGLLLGLPLTSESMGELSKAAIVLGKAMGLNAKQSLDSLITGLGRSSPLLIDNLGITVKVGKANEAYAKKLGTTVSELTDAEKKTAFYQETVKLARAEVQKLGGIQLTFGDRVQQTSVLIEDFTNKLAIATAKSPVFAAGLKSVKESLERAFGPDTEGQITGIVNIIERAAIASIELGIAGVESAGFITRSYAGLRLEILGVGRAFTFVAEKMAKASAFQIGIAEQIPILGRAYKDAGDEARAAAVEGELWNASLDEQISKAALAALGHTEFGEALRVLREVLIGAKTEMVNAGVTQRDMTQATAEGVTQVTGMGTALSVANFQMAALTPVMVDWQGKLVETSDSARLWQEIMGQAFRDTKTDVEGFGLATVGVGDLVMANNRRVQESARRLGIVTREESKKTEDQITKDLDNLVQKYGEYSKEVIEAQKKLDEFRRKSSEETTIGLLKDGETLQEGTTRIFLEAGANFKASAVAGVKIAVQAAIAKSLAAAPWPFNLILAAGAAAAGAIVINRIQGLSPGFREGTRRLDYQDFGRSSRETLHGEEAIIPRGRGHLLADEIAASMGGSSRVDLAPLQEELRGLRADFKSLPRAIQRAVRDGVLLAG